MAGKGLGVGGVLLVFFLLAVIVVGGWFLWDYLAVHDRVSSSPGDVADGVSELLAQNRNLSAQLNESEARAADAEQRLESQGVPTGAVFFLRCWCCSRRLVS